jgi:manganese/iron transport system permease protein
MPLIDYLADPLREGYMTRAMIEVLVMGLVTGAIGTFIVVRGLSFMGDALSHAILPGVVIAFLLGEGMFFGALAAGVLTAAMIGVVASNQRVKEDSAIGVLFAAAFALGYLLISTSDRASEELEHILFGDVLGVSTNDIVLSGIAGALVLVMIVVFYRELVITSFDRGAAQAMGLPVLALDLLLLIMISLTIVVSLRAVGNILVVAMLVTPAATARLLTDRLPVMIMLGSLIGVASGITGLYIAYHNDVAAGGTIVLVATGLFGLAWLFAPQHGYVMTHFVQRRLAAGVPETTILFESPEIQTPHEP